MQEYYRNLDKMNEDEYSYSYQELIGKSQHYCVLSYYDVNRRRFEFLTCILVIYDSVIVPFYLSFGPNTLSQSTQDILKIVDISIKFIFFLDLIIAFRKAYIDEAGL